MTNEEISNYQGLLKRVFNGDDGEQLMDFLKRLCAYDSHININQTEILWRYEGGRDMIRTISALLKFKSKQIEEHLKNL